MLYAVGLTEEDMHKAQIGIASLWWEGWSSSNKSLCRPPVSYHLLPGNPCNVHLLELAKKVKQGCEAEGMLGLTFNTVGVRYVDSACRV